MGQITRRGLLQRAAAGAALSAVPLVPAFAKEKGPSGGVWLPGDLHTHSTYSHDVYGGPTDDNTGIDESYTLGLPVAGKFAEAKERNLRYLAVTDHNDVRSIPELASASGGLIALPGYEHSLRGHAQMLGATGLYNAGDQAADAVAAMAERLRDAGGVFQANHPAYKVALDAEFEGCAHGCEDCRTIHWTYGFDVRPDTIEVWNPSVARSDVSELYWECWLDRGKRVGATGGSDSHWLSLHGVAGPGQPTTWIYAPEASARGLLEGLRAGRTTISGQPPALGGVQLLLEAPGEGMMIGDRVPPGSTLSVSALGLTSSALLRIRANGDKFGEDREINPGETITFKAPREAGWVRAILLAPVALPDVTTDVGSATPQRDGMPMLAMTSPIYIRHGVGSRLHN